MVQLDEQVLRRLHRARGCVFEMFRDRGYALRCSPYPEAEFAARLHATRKEDVFGALSISARTPKKRSVKAFFCYSDKVGIGVVRDIVAHCTEHGVQHVLLVYESAITPFARARLDELSKDGDVPVTACELHTFDQLQLNPTTHVDVPPHALLGKEAAQALLERKGVSRETLPKILASDVLSRYFAAHRGQIFRIERPNPEGVVDVVHRVVV